MYIDALKVSETSRPCEKRHALHKRVSQEGYKNPDYATMFRGRPLRFVMPVNPVTVRGNVNRLPHTKSEAHYIDNGRIFVKPELLCSLGCETPQIHYEKYSGKKYRYFYAISSDVDLDNPGTVREHDSSEGISDPNKLVLLFSWSRWMCRRRRGWLGARTTYFPASRFSFRDRTVRRKMTESFCRRSSGAGERKTRLGCWSWTPRRGRRSDGLSSPRTGQSRNVCTDGSSTGTTSRMIKRHEMGVIIHHAFSSADRVKDPVE